MRNVHQLGIITALAACGFVLSGFLFADDTNTQPATIHSASAKAAIAKEANAEAAAMRELRKAVVKAEQQEITELKISQRNAITANDLDDATQIGQLIQHLQADIDGVKPAPKFTLWRLSNGQSSFRIWLKADGTAITETGDKGQWTQNDKKIVVKWREAIDSLTLADDSQSFTGINQHGLHLAGKLLGTDLTGADAPEIQR